MTSSDDVDVAWRSHRPYLVNLAYQMLGDVGDAEDVAQEAFLRLARTDVAQIDDVRAWLTVVAGRLCLDQLRSARVRHESTDETDQLETAASVDPNPADRVTLDDEVRTALWEMLRRLSPGERVAFVLHDVFQMPFAEIAETVGRPVGTCRQLARRARAKFSDASPRVVDVSDVEHQAVAEKFITACANGDLQALTAVLDPRVWGVGTLLGEGTPPPQVNHGTHDVAVNLLRYVGRGSTLVTGPAGQPVLLAFRDRRLFAVLVLTLRDGLVRKIEATVDPSAATSR
ncbi:RNA polymerase subunit sigma [Mycolicibacterium moriokaense]|uniref:Alternative RNA polymerase SigI n=1 Tax=Mycolicibacterium moriokaense TaxID=39691 RepID=A0AAD1M874_9MYCO|nr:RNA polymerase sigma factor SigI [Mycolicibacterium moriokaense]MCV7040286.1 RNA polymerase sigma factor SigI [Mycolicibacterium moriokaense]ORB25988.1 RNA polymerase subunit sigma [Mycolicibacterium moriokaense]BBX03225.1 putative alternative RNA polymerase SigI [Mycolicibacterium moriokaense]